MNRRLHLVALSIVLSLGAAAVPSPRVMAVSRSAVGPAVEFPQPDVARASAEWLAGQLTPGGWVPNGVHAPSPSFTANTLLALVAARVDPVGVKSALSYLEGTVDSYVTQNGADGPGQLALLILDAEAAGADPAHFGGTNLVARLLATEQADGLFGTPDQVANYAAGNYEQGLALQALAAAGVTAEPGVASAVSYLRGQQCPDGGWSFTDQATDSCVVDATAYTGPDTNSTAEALQGLAAQDALTPAVASGALDFYGAGQDADGGWSYYPNSAGDPQATDSNSTSCVIEALVSIGHSPTDSLFVHGSSDPVTALLGFQVTTGPGAGGFAVTPGSGTADVTASFQATPAIAGLSFPFPFRASTTSYWTVGSDGGVFALGGAAFHGSMGGTSLHHPIVGLAAAPDGGGYWLVGSDGGVFAFGDAAYHGSMGGTPLHRPIVGIAAAPDGGGYWLVGSDGGVFAFGDAAYHGSMGGTPLHRPIVGIAAAPDDGGYWLVGSDGGVFAFGDAAYHGSMGGTPLHGPIVGIAAAPDGGGYWLVGSDGGVFAFGDAAYHGSMGGTPLHRPIVGIAAAPDGGGYWLVGSDGGVFAFGDAGFGGVTMGSPVVGVAPAGYAPAPG